MAWKLQEFVTGSTYLAGEDSMLAGDETFDQSPLFAGIIGAAPSWTLQTKH